MATKAIFIGINKYSDSRMLELGGARRDATALWALFTDTLPDLSARLIVDENATYSTTVEAISQTLSGAADDDVIVLSFAGHGTPEGQLVFYDTDSANLSATAMPMAALAEMYRACKARAVLCILDCCFSGQAPARVLEGVAPARSAFAFNSVHGNGRILLAACATNESAYEQPGSGHGLLTFATIEAMSRADAGIVTFPEIAGEIINRARVEALRMGVTQTPVFLGSVQGGLTFPTFRRGNNYHSAFPPTSIVEIRGSFSELAAHGFPPAVVDAWTARFPEGPNKLQAVAVNDCGVLDRQPLMVVAPTSSGKTLIGELAAVQAVVAGRKAVFLLPYRALVNEKYDEFVHRYEPTGLRVARCSGDATDGISRVLGGRYDLAICTYEMFLSMALGTRRLLNQLGLLVLDEGQFITDPRRGITVELILALLLRMRDSGVNRSSWCCRRCWGA